MSAYKLKYQALDNKGNIIKTGTVICYRKMSKFDAIAGYENHLKAKNSDINKIKVIYCAIKTVLGFMPEFDNQSDDFAKQFKDAIIHNKK